MNDVAAAVGQDLDLDVTGSRDQLLDKHRAVAERRQCFALAAGEGRRHLIGASDRAHAAAAAARRRFQHDRIADRFADSHGVLGARQGLRAARNDRDAERARQIARLGLVAEQRQRLGARPDEGDALFEASLCEAGILGQEAVAGMHAIAATGLGGLDQRFDVEISAHRIA